MTQELIERLRATWKHDAWIATNRTAPPIRGEVEKLVNPDGPEAVAELQSQSARIAEYRDIFAEITAKARPECADQSDPERITNYSIPVGPIHRAAGKLGFQMFDGEAHLRNAAARIAELEGESGQLREALERCRNELGKGRPIYSDSATLIRGAIEAKRHEWFCSGADCEPYDHGRDEGLKLALEAFDAERDRIIAAHLTIVALDQQARASLTKDSTSVTG